MSASVRACCALPASAFAYLIAASAAAAPCGRPDVDFSYPYSGAVGVPTNATLSAHYAAPVSYSGEAVTLSDSSGAAVATGSLEVDSANNVLAITPSLTPGAYTLSWPALKAVNGGLGRGSIVSFSVKAEQDTQAPRFQGLTGIDWDLARESDPCLSGLQDRYALELTLGLASDDSDTSLLALLVFQSVDSGVRLAAAEPIATVPFPASGKLTIKRSAPGTTCFKARVVDLTGRDSGGGEPEVCKTTREPPFFEGCSLSPAGRARAARGWLLGALALGLWLRRGARANALSRRR